MRFGRCWHARGRELCRGEPGLSGKCTPDSARVEGSLIVDKEVLNPCARGSKARSGRFMREKLVSDNGLFSPYEGQ